MSAILFYVFAGLTVAGALAVVANVKSTGVGAFGLAASMLGLGAVYVLLDAYFIAALQVLLPAGAVAVVFIATGTLLAPRRDRMRPARGFGTGVVAVVLAALAGSGFAVLLPDAFPEPAAAAEGFGGYRTVGLLLFTDRAVLFEALSLLLLSAIVGAIVLTRPERD